MFVSGVNQQHGPNVIVLPCQLQLFESIFELLTCGSRCMVPCAERNPIDVLEISAFDAELVVELFGVNHLVAGLKLFAGYIGSYVFRAQGDAIYVSSLLEVCTVSTRLYQHRPSPRPRRKLLSSANVFYITVAKIIYMERIEI